MGRVKQFDESAVLEKAMLCFWKNGYENTSVRKLEKDMGINQFSIYATFKSKDELYKRALVNYSKQLDKLYLKPLKSDTADITDVKTFLEKFALSIKDNKVPNSCLMVSSVIRFDNYDHEMKKIIIDFFNSMKALFRKAIKNSIQSNLIPGTTDVKLAAEYLIGIAQSISVYSKLNSRNAIKKYIHYSIENLN